MAFDIPDSCTLPSQQRPLRLAEFGALLTQAIAVERGDQRNLHFFFDDSDGLDARIRDLAHREANCCSFFEFHVAHKKDQVMLGITVPHQHTGILDSLQTLSEQNA